MKTQDRIFAGKRKATYKKMYRLGFNVANEFLNDLEHLFGADRLDYKSKISAINCALGAPGTIMPSIHGNIRKKYFESGVNSI